MQKVRDHTSPAGVVPEPTTKEIHRGQRGISGLDSILVFLIPVAVVAVMAYVLISAGFFFAETSNETVNTGISGKTAVMEIGGTVVAIDVPGDNGVDIIEFNLQSILSLEAPIDLHVTTDTDGDGILSDEANKSHTTVMSYSQGDTVVADIAWTKNGLGKNDGDDLLEAGEQFTIAVDLTALPANNPLGTFDTFTIEIKPAVGSTLVLTRTMPSVLSAVMTFR